MKTFQCDHCSEQAYCQNGVCVCQEGYTGDGVECVYNCPNEYIWSGETCVPAVSEADEGFD